MARMHVVIPARYASTRLPGKPLIDVAGKPIVQHTYERAHESGIKSIVIATDDDRIKSAAEKFGASVCMTGAEHNSGTERIAEVIEKIGIDDDDIVINVQGDEPIISGQLIRRVADTLAGHAKAVVATACCPIMDSAELNNPNAVKVAFDTEGYALAFSRAPIPSNPTRVAGNFRHIGIYAYRAGYVGKYVRLAPCIEEQTERLEQLRVLHYGDRIAVCVVDEEEAPKISVDTPADLERLQEYFRGKLF